MVTVKIYVEGGGDRSDLRTRCRNAFSEFFRGAGFQGRMPSIVACGSRNNAFDSFTSALNRNAPDVIPLLLVDSESAVPADISPWVHLRDRDSWQKPDKADDKHAHLMVQCMEAWFLADLQALRAFFGKDFRHSALPRIPPNGSVETIPKSKLMSGLKAATAKTKSKGSYSKGEHSFKLLAQIDPKRVLSASQYAQRLYDTLDAMLQQR